MTDNCATVTLKLENGFELKIEDTSRRISADAFVVKALLTIDFDLGEEDATSMGMDLGALKEALGNEALRFEKSLERNFIMEPKKESVFEEMISSYLATNRVYLSHSDFKKGVIRRKIIEKRGRYWQGE